MFKANKRTVVLAALLLASVVLFVAKPVLGQVEREGAQAKSLEPPLPGENKISAFKLERNAEGEWSASVDYFFTGQPANAAARLQLLVNENDPDSGIKFAGTIGYRVLKRGSNHLSIPVTRPLSSDPIAIRAVAVEMYAMSQVLARQQVNQAISWPDLQTWSRDQELKNKSPEQILAAAVDLIDNGDKRSLLEAKRRLEMLLAKDPRLDAAYIELARVAMKSNWGTEGLHQAENLLQSALQIAPGSVNAKVLLGYVYTHQARYPQAEKLFADAAATEHKNLWLWADWGELLARQGKTGPAIQKYTEAITRPLPTDTYLNARLDAYEHLLPLLERSDRLDEAERLYKQRADEFACHAVDYAKFMLQRRGDTAPALSMADKILTQSCDEADARMVLAAAHYMTWATAKEPQRPASLNQARVFLPASAELMYFLASSDRTVIAAEQLKASGESIDQRDNHHWTALAYALDRRDLAAARRLLKLGASATATVGVDDLPVAMLPVIQADLEAIALIQQFGVDYTQLRYRGATAAEHARATGNRKLAEALDKRGRDGV